LDMLALLTVEGPQIGMGRLRFDPGKHAALTLRAAWPSNGKQRWVGVIIGFRHVMLLGIRREHNTLCHRW